MFSYFVTFSIEKFSLVVEEEKNFTKNNEGWRISHENEHKMKNILSHASTYFLTFYTNQLFFLSFSILLLNEALKC